MHIIRLEEIFEALGEEPSGETCKAMEGLIAEDEVNPEAAASARRVGS